MKDEEASVADGREPSSFRLPPSSFLRRYVPALAFVGGFVWDALTLGRVIKPVDLFLLLGYLLAAAAILVAIGRRIAFRGSQYLNTALQFLFGGIFSALFIFYFLSSSDLPGYLVAFALAVLLIGNEFLESRYSELTLSWAFFTLAALMFFNFALAHLFRSISTFWFYLGTLLAVLAVLVVRKVSKAEAASIRPALGVAVVMVVLHVVNAIPPVPLVKKEMLVAHDLRKTATGYVAVVESGGWRFWRPSSGTFHRAGGERVYCFTSVFVPQGITTTIRHRWQHETGDGWQEAGTIPFRITGGRQTGYRGYTFKQNVTPGRWRVIAESEGGAAIGVITFEIRPGKRTRTRTMVL